MADMSFSSIAKLAAGQGASATKTAAVANVGALLKDPSKISAKSLKAAATDTVKAGATKATSTASTQIMARKDVQDLAKAKALEAADSQMAVQVRKAREYLAKNWKPIAGGLGALVALFIAYSIYKKKAKR